MRMALDQFMKSMKTTLAKCFFLAFVFSTPVMVNAQSSPAFPLKFSTNKRYLVDRNNQPFLIKEFSAWGAIQVLSEKDEADFLDALKRKGFNAVMVSVLSNATSQMAGNPPYWQGVSPLKVKWDFSTPNETYFQHVDRFFKMAEQRGFLAMAVPVYLGYPTIGSQGWWDEFKNPNNSIEKMRKFGEFLGERYKNTPNLMWVAGGDNDGKGELYEYELNVIQGIKAKDPDHYWTGHFDSNGGTHWSTMNPLYADYIDIDGFYIWSEAVLFEAGPQYVSELRQYKKGKMIIQLDQSYEHDLPYYADNENYQWIRRKMYDGLLSGCKGTSFSSGTIENQCYTFKNWRPLMNTEGMNYVALCFKLFDSLPWHEFVPDESNEIILSGRGEFGSIDYVCAAQSPDKKYYVMYIPKGHTVILNVPKMSGKSMRMHWYSPRTGKSLRIGGSENKPRFGITAPSEEDWVVVFDCDPNFKMPGLIK